MIAADLAEALDPVVFARRAGLEPDGWQAAVLRSVSPRVLLNCSRQSGKTTATALLGLHRALYVPNSLVLILSPSLRQSAEFFRTLSVLYTRIGARVPAKAESALRLELGNGSRVISLPASEATVRGFAAVDLLLIDEASRVPDALYRSVTPMLATSSGRLIGLGTPYGQRGWWHEAWTQGEDWERVRITANDVPRIPAAWLETERRSMPAWVFAQEYEGVFGETDEALFSLDLIDAAITDQVAPLFPGGLFRATA